MTSMANSTAAVSLTSKMAEMVASSKKERFSLALSGGSSPIELFKLWRGEYLSKIEWSRIDFYFVDERCVSADSPESNYGMVKRELFDYLPLSENQIFRIIGENDSEKEALRYNDLLKSRLAVKEVYSEVYKNEIFSKEFVKVPVFDFVIAGIGDDAHTSSIFPGDVHLLYSSKPYETSVNPYSGQKRVAMTGTTLLNAEYVAYYANGVSKREIIDKVLSLHANRNIETKSYTITKFPVANLLRRAQNSKVFYG